MANEATILSSENTQYRQITIGNASAVPKGTLIIIDTDPNTGDIHRGSANLYPVGFAAVEKTANDGQTTIPVIVRGDVDAVADGSIAIGALVCPGTTANRVRAVGALSVEKMGNVLGRCLETAADAEQVRIRLLMLG